MKESGIAITIQQTEILEALATGITIKEIAKKRGVSNRTIETTLQRLRNISECKNNVELICWAIKYHKIKF